MGFRPQGTNLPLITVDESAKNKRCLSRNTIGRAVLRTYTSDCVPNVARTPGMV